MEKICPLVKGQCTYQYCEFWINDSCLPREAWAKYITPASKEIVPIVPKPIGKEPGISYAGAKKAKK